MDMKRLFLRAFLCLALTFTLSGPVGAADNYTWTGGGGGDGKWENDANWNIGGTSPGADPLDTATIDGEGGGSADVLVDGDTGNVGIIFLTVGQTDFGTAGDSNLAIYDGAEVTATVGIIIGDGTDSRGRIYVYDDGSMLSTLLTITVGNEGDGALILTEGGKAAARGSVYLGGYSDSGYSTGTGTVSVDGAGSELVAATIGGKLFVGNYGEGVLNLTDGGKATVNGGNGEIVLGSETGSSGTLNIGDSGAAGIVNAAVVSGGDGGGTVNFDHDATSATPYYFTKDGTSSGAAVNLTDNLSVVNTAGYTVLTGTNTYTGDTTINDGTLRIQGNGLLGYDSATPGEGDYAGNITIASGAVLDFSSDADSQTLSGDISGAGKLILNNTGEVVLTGNNTGHSGDTEVTNGILTIQTDNNLGTGLRTLDGGALWFAGGDGTEYTKGWTLGDINGGNSLGIYSDSVTLSGDLTGAGGFTKDGDGELILTGTNTYGGSTRVNEGTLAGNIAFGTNLIVASGATYDSMGAGRVVNSLYGGGEVINDDFLAVRQGYFRGEISGEGLLLKYGTETLTLRGENTFTGALGILGGTVRLVGNGTLATETVALFEGATFSYSGANTAYTFKNLGISGMDTTINPGSHGADLNGATMTFLLPDATLETTDVMLTINGNADITGSIIRIGVLATGGTPGTLTAGDMVTLITTTGTLTADQNNQYAEMLGGIATIYDGLMTTDGNNLWLEITGLRSNDRLKALSEGRLAGLAFAGWGTDLILGPGMYAAMLETERKGAGLVPFGAVSGGSVRYDTGSHIDVDGIHMLAGLAWRVPVAAKTSLVTGAFFEAGWGSYDTRNSFDGVAVKGKGDTDYYGGGLLGRYEGAAGPGSIYTEASFRAGYANTDFKSNTVHTSGNRTSYDSGSLYFGAHAGAGYIWNINKKASLDLSLKYIWLHMNSDSVRISGEEIKFKSADSQRWRTGGKLSYAVNRYITPYAGAYFDYEVGGKAKATVNGNKIDAPELRGGTGQGELGLVLTPAPNLPLSLDLGVQGYVGTREGVTGSLRMNYEF